MSTQNTERPEAEETRARTETDRQPRARRFLSTVWRQGRNGTVAVLAGGALLAGAVRTASRSKRRAGILALLGGSLLFVGVRRRRSWSTEGGDDGPTQRGAGPTGGVDADGEVSAEAEAHRDRSDVMHQTEANPRGVSGEPDVENRTDPEEGAIRFTADQDEGSGPKTDLDESTEADPRLPDDEPSGTSDDHVEVDLSEAAMADEASEATGPTPEQAYPSMEGTDPEPTSPEAPEAEAERSDADVEEESDAGNHETDDVSEDADGGSEAHDEEAT